MDKNKKTIDLYENSNQILNASIDKITVKIISKYASSNRAQVLVLTGCSPLAGTTSISISLAIAMAATGRKTVLVDCDVRKSSVYKKLNDYVHEGLADYLSAKSEINDRVDEILYTTNKENLLYVPCGESDENPTRILCSERMDSFLEYVKKENDCIILDLPSFSVVPDAQIMFGKSDGVVVVSALGETKKSQIKDLRKLISLFRDKYLGMIINKVPLDIFKANVRNFDYYLLDKNGKQQFEKRKETVIKSNKKKKGGEKI